MTTDPQALNFTTSTTSFNGKKVVASNQSAVLSLSANELVTATVSSQSVPITLAGVNISNAYTNGVAAVAATTTLTLDDAIESTSLSTDPYVQFTDAGGQTRTYFGVSTLGVSGSATFTFDKAATLNEYITLTSYFDGASATVSFKAAARGTTNGSTAGGYTLFAVDDATSTGDPTSAVDAAANLVAAINSSSGLPNLEAYANRVSDTDATTANGKVYLKARDAAAATNTAIALSTVTAATATIIGTAALDDEDGTDFILRNADASTVTLHTDPTKNFGDTSSDDGDHRWILNTRDISGGSEVRKATQALWIACKTAIDAGELDMTITPSTVDTIADGSQVDFLLTQTTSGSDGNTAITLVTGVTASGETAFTGGTAFTDSTSVNPPAAFTGGVDEAVDISKNKWSRKGSAENAAESLKDAINETSSGHGYANGLTATRSGTALTITQDVGGTEGNTAVAYNSEFQEICSVLPKAFAGGLAAATPKFGIQYSTNGTDWTTPVEVASDVVANETGIKLFTLPEGVTSYPAYRLVFNYNLTTAGTSGRLTFVGAY